MHVGKVTAVFQRRTCLLFWCANLVEKQLSNFKNASVSRCSKNSSLTIIWNNLGLSYHKCMKRNLEFRKKTYSKIETPFNKRSAKYSTQNDGMVERCHKCIRVRGHPLNNGLNHSLLKLQQVSFVVCFFNLSFFFIRL